MINIPDRVIELLKRDNAQKNFRVHFPNGERADITKDNIIEVSFSESICSQGFKFGLCETPSIEFVTFDIENIKGKTIECSAEIIDDDSTVYSIPYGRFVVASCRRNSILVNQRKVVAYANDLASFPLSEFEKAKERFPSPSNVPYTVNVQRTVLSMYDFEKQEGTYTDLSTETINVTIKSESTYIGRTTYGIQCVAYHLDTLNKSKGLYWIECAKALKNIDEVAAELGISGELKEEYAELLDPFVAYGVSNVVGGEKPYIIPYANHYVYPYVSAGTSAPSGAYICIPIKGFVSSNYNYIESIIRSDDCNIQNCSLTSELSLNTSLQRTKYSYTSPLIPAGQNPTVIDTYLVKDADMLSASDIISGYFELLGAFVKTGRDGSIQSCKLGTDAIEYDASMISDIWVDDAGTKPYGRIYCEYTNNDGKRANFYHYLIPSGEWDSERYRTYSISDNALIQNNTWTSSTLHSVVSVLADALRNLSYMPLEMSSIGMPFVEPGDEIVIHANDVDVVTYVLSRTISGIDVLMDSIQADADEDDVDYISAQTQKSEASSEVEEQITALQNGKMDINGVSAVQSLTSGKEIGSIIINGIETKLFAPNDGGGGGGGNIKVGYAYKRGSASIAANAYEEVSLSVTLPEGAIPISVVPGQTGTYAEVWARGQLTYENNVLTQAVYVHNRSTGSTAICYPTIQVWYLLGASQYDGGSLTNEEEEEL